MRAVRFLDPSGDVKLGRLDGEVIFDAGPAGPRGFVPSEEGWRTIADASGLAHPIEDVRLGKFVKIVGPRQSLPRILQNIRRFDQLSFLETQPAADADDLCR